MRKIGSIQCLESHPKQEQESGQQTLHMFLFHGYGADAYDLRSLSEVIEGKDPIHFLFPQGPLEVPIGPGWTGRAWWPIDIASLEAAARNGKPRDLAHESPAQLANLRDKIIQSIDSLKIPWSKIILGGFSQGAMLATHVFLHAPQTPKALVSLSGALLDKASLEPVVRTKSGGQFFISHGKSDAILSARGSAQLETFLLNAGLKGKIFNFEGAHEIPMEVIIRLNQFLKSL
jgi:phospholipase/carboxylesterase